ncbi:hypothetical protein F0P96_08465 [Hymenobacter busanensis]|uniref:Uncharacterized protein n=1 Tax=Hymenobacter busanensis TaxID=2607656 RepID=A0A7L4ZYL2_9BACT|nr:hypothetical protein [Hymenobacter busanensis]KAA9333008.1 hypothetical protein F0P96_08465 [Hymenobacter busanensis]QHJ08318.1 hypothetical protein GUY19_13865 [Hymenobacter busanensis]
MSEPILQLVHQAHALTETAAASATDALERKKLILADLSLHLVQAALQHPRPEPAALRRYLFSILTVADGFVDELDLKSMAETLLPPPAAPATPAE